MTSHYDNLGVTPTATPDEIKKAYRAKARDLHPDKGGSAKDFAPVAAAYETLKDPQRRLLYDTTGQDQRPPIEQEVQKTLMQGFQAALAQEQDIEITAFVRNGITLSAKQIPEQIKKLKSRQKKLTAKRKKIKTKGPVNVVHLIIDAELKNIEGQLANLDHQTEVAKACFIALDTYEEDWAAPTVVTYEDLVRRQAQSDQARLAEMMRQMQNSY